MKIVILGKKGCGKCESAKDKMKLMDLKFEYVELDNATNWKKTGAVKALAAAAFAGLDFGKPPVIVVDGDAYTYSKGIKVLKGVK